MQKIIFGLLLLYKLKKLILDFLFFEEKKFLKF
jgi:hypothetical protein